MQLVWAAPSTVETWIYISFSLRHIHFTFVVKELLHFVFIKKQISKPCLDLKSNEKKKHITFHKTINYLTS